MHLRPQGRGLYSWLACAAAILISLASFTLFAQTPGAESRLAYPLLHTREQTEARVRAFNEGLPYIPGEILVKFKDGVSGSQQLRALSVSRDAVDVGASQRIGDALLLRAPNEQNAEAWAFVLARQPEVEWVQPNYISRFQMTPSDPSYQRQWNFEAIGLPLAWDINHGASSSVTVAVIDSGVTVTGNSQIFPLWNGFRILNVLVPFGQNPDIASSRYSTARDFAFWNGPVLDMVGHGTHIAGTVLQETNNNVGFAGIAYGARLMALKACIGYWELQIFQSASGIAGYVNPNLSGGCVTSDVVNAVRFAADNGAQVINLSIGGFNPSPAYLDVLRYAIQRGAFVAMAVGNEFEEGNPTEYPAAYGPQVEGAMTVGAVGRSRRRAYYSNTGPAVEIVAPGGDIRDGGVPGQIYQAGLFDPDFDPRTIALPRFDRYADAPKQGSSFATPHIAGVAALLYTQGIKNPAAIEAAIKRSATDLGATGRDDEFGAGLVDARAALRGLGVAK